MTDNFFAEFARQSYQPPPGFELVDDKDYPPPARTTSARGLEAAGASGLNAGLAGMLGAPVDIANAALRGVGLETSAAPIMGSAWLRGMEQRVGIRPDLAPDATTAEKIAHAAGYGAAATTVPAAGVGLLGEAGIPVSTAQAITGAPTATTAALGAAAGGAGGAAAEAAPKGFETAASLAAQLATGHAAGKALGAVTPAEAPPSNIEQFLTQADEAAARAAGAKTRAEIDQFIRDKEAGGSPAQIAPPVENAQPQPSEGPQAVQPPNAEAQTGIRTAPAKVAAPEDIEPARAVVEPAENYQPPEGFEEIKPGIAPNSAASAQLAEKPAISTPEIRPEIRPEIAPDYAAPEGTFREDEFGMPQLVEATGLRPIDIDPQAATAAKQHIANGATPDVAYEHAVIEAALADPKVQGIQDGEQLPAAPEPIQNALAAPPEPRPPIAGAGATQVQPLEQSPTPGAPEAASTTSLTDAAGRPHVLDTSQPSDAIAKHLLGQGALSRDDAAKLTGHNLKDPQQLKAFEENVELGVVKAARHIIRAIAQPEVYDRLVRLYEDQPKLGTRTSSSMRDQAYSTPIPLAYAASRLAGVGPDKTVYEPSAGNGALLIEAHAVDTVANELNPGRLNALKSQGFLAMNKDASKPATAEAAEKQNDGPFDIVLANPPFGVRHGEGGAGDRFDLSRFQPGYETGEIDHAIALNSLAAMKPGGRAVLILGGPSPLARTDEARVKAYGAKAKREFYKTLYDRFNVSGHVTVSGDLYEKQGAGWPVDVISISGAGKSKLPYPMMTAPPMLKSWDEVKEHALAQQPSHPQPASEPRDETNAPSPAVGAAGHDLANKPLDVGRGNVGPANRSEVEPAALRGATIPREHEHREPPAANQPAERPMRGEPGGHGAPRPAERRTPGVGAKPPQPEAPKEAETENQVAYSPKSTAGTKLGTLAPRNMRDASDAALARVESRHGPIAKYVSHELGYKAADLGKHYSAEQVDALGLAIDNIERGGSLVLGDQTGIGKGRVLAGIIRYGIRQKMTPVFVTEKANLYSAMFDDMTDIGMQDMLGREPTILPTDADLKLPIGNQGTILKTPNGTEQDQRLRDAAATGKLPDHDMIMTTYSQMQTVKGQNTARRDFLQAMAPNAIVLFDESHNAGGSGVEKRVSKNKGPPQPDRAEFARELVDKAKAVVYSSATYAKRPDSMRLYSKTDMRYAVGNMKDLGEAIKKGGVPMQQVVASALAESGQYLRRERSFDGIKYDMEVTPIDRALYAGFSKALRAINDFSKVAGKSVKAIDKEVKAEAAIAGQDASVGTAGAESTNFTSLMHNVVAQFLLASKAERAGQLAVEAINKGERPVIAVANTLESFVSDYMDQTGAKTGDLIKASFGDLLSRYLDRSRVVTIKKPFGAVSDKHTMTDEELGPEGLAAYHAAQAIINGLDFGKLPISPIDKIRQVISAAGHAVSEITGRNNILDYGRGNIPQIMTRSPKEKSVAGRTQTVKDFNSGKLKALILNESGATGISLHDSETFPESGRGQRAMIIAQAHPNIDTHMQMLGRVNRTGQVSKPRYAQLGADVAAEKRPMAVLAKKLASLNANTTASAKSGLSGKGAVDFLNRYGDEVVTQVMLDDLRAHIDMGEPLKSLSPTEPTEDAARKMTGRIAFLEPDAQDRVMDAIESQYKAKIDDLDERGENALEAKLLDLKAKYEGGADISQKTGDSPFQDAVHVGTYDVKSDRKPPKFDDVMKSAYAMLGREIVPKYAPLEALQTAGGKANAAMMTRADQAFDEYKSAMLAITKDPEVAAEQNQRLADGREAMRDKLAAVYPGAMLNIVDDAAPLPYALVVGVKHEGKALNPYAPSSWAAVLAMPGYGTRTMPFSQLTTSGEADAMKVEPSSMKPDELSKMFDSFKTEIREKRVIATGNLLAAYDLLRRAGQIVHFTTDSGDVKQGIILPRKQTSFKDVVAGAVKKLTDPGQIIRYLEKPGGGDAVSSDEVIKITSRPQGGFLITVAGARAVGGKYFLDPGVLEALGQNEFIKRGAEMRATAYGDTAPAVFEALIKAGANFQQLNHDKLRETSNGNRG